MELGKCIAGRRSIRKYLDKSVSREDILELIKAAQKAPSWKNSQVSRFHVVDTPEIKEKFLDCMPDFNKDRAGSASALIVTTVVNGICGFNEDGGYSSHLKDGFQYFDNGLQVENMCLKAYEMGLGTLIMGLYDAEMIRELLNIPEDEVIVTVVAVGYYDVHPDMPERKNINDIVKFY